VLDALLSCTSQVVALLPLESELIGAAAQCLVALSATKNAARLSYIVNHEFVGVIAQYVTSVGTGSSAGSSGSSGGCRLNAAGLVAMYECMGQIFVRARHEAYFTHVSTVSSILQLFFFALCCTWMD